MAKTIDRIFELINVVGVSVRQFDLSIGASNGYSLRMKKNNASVGSDVLERIVEKYPFVNVNWLVTGRGNMFDPETRKQSEITADEIQSIIESKIKSHQQEELKSLMEIIKSEIENTRNKMDSGSSKQ